MKLIDLVSGIRSWVQINGTPVSFKSMSSSHFQNSMNIIKKNGYDLNEYEQGEVLAREIIKLLESNQAALATWLTSEEKSLRILAKRALKEEDSKGWEV